MLSQFLDSITAFVEKIVLRFGSPGIMFIAFVENLFPPTPSEMLYPLAGKIASDGRISFIGIVIAGTLGSMAGSLLYYGLGYRLGQDRTRDFIASFGTLRLFRFKVTLVSVEEFDRGLALFRRHGTLIVLIARLMPLVHSVISIPAGVTRMNIVLFTLYTLLGSSLWITPLAGFGYWLGGNWMDVLAWLDYYENAVLILLALIIAYYLYRRRRGSQLPGRKHIRSLW